jgi:hypothetical protein
VALETWQGTPHSSLDPAARNTAAVVAVAAEVVVDHAGQADVRSSDSWKCLAMRTKGREEEERQMKESRTAVFAEYPVEGNVKGEEGALEAIAQLTELRLDLESAFEERQATRWGPPT